MEINQEIIQILKALKDVKNRNIDEYLSIDEDTASIVVNDNNLVEINEDSIILNKKIDVEKKILLNDNKNRLSTDVEHLITFIGQISSSIIRLNHLGINYSCNGIENEIKEYKQFLSPNLRMFEEKSNFMRQRWLFIRDIRNWDAPLFELVLTQSERSVVSKWVPHFQVDIDTILESENIKRISKDHFKRNFIEWELNIPNYGVVMGMGILNATNKTKLCIGIGTDIRDTQYHRKHSLKEL